MYSKVNFHLNESVNVVSKPFDYQNWLRSDHIYELFLECGSVCVFLNQITELQNNYILIDRICKAALQYESCYVV